MEGNVILFVFYSLAQGELQPAVPPRQNDAGIFYVHFYLLLHLKACKNVSVWCSVDLGPPNDQDMEPVSVRVTLLLGAPPPLPAFSLLSTCTLADPFTNEGGYGHLVF